MPSSTALSSRSVAITGAGSGLGREIALGFAAKGYAVFGTAMSEAEVQELKDASDGRVRLSICDMTREAAVQFWADGVSDALGDTGLDLLINNAGILTPGPIEVLPLDAIRREFDVNVFGALSVINAFLPALRKARGRIVQVSTWTASVPLPFNGPSGASKAAMEVFSAVYRAELKSSGIDVVIASAGNMKTGGPAKTASALTRISNGMTSGTAHVVRARVRHVCDHAQQHAKQWARCRVGRRARDRTGRAGSRAKPGRGRSRRRGDAQGSAREIRCRTGCPPLTDRRSRLIPPYRHFLGDTDARTCRP